MEDLHRGTRASLLSRLSNEARRELLVYVEALGEDRVLDSRTHSFSTTGNTQVEEGARHSATAKLIANLATGPLADELGSLVGTARYSRYLAADRLLSEALAEQHNTHTFNR